VEVLDNSQLFFRAHILELVETLAAVGAQLHVVSGGISDMIYSSMVSVAGRELTEKVVRIHSNAWEAYGEAEQGQLLRFTPRLVHSYNKHLVMREMGQKKKHCVLLGDLKSDIYMAYGAGYETVLSCFYGKQGEFDQRALAEAKFDVIIEGDGSHKIVIELLKILSGQRNVDWPYLYRVEPILTTLIL
jgi:phosphoserine phosphatase